MGSITEHKRRDPETGDMRTTGQYRAHIRINGYKSKSKLFRTRSEAKRWIRDNEHSGALERAPGSLIEGAPNTFAELCDLFMATPPERGTRTRTISQVAWWRDQLGGADPTKITRRKINQLKHELQRKPACRNTPHGPIETGGEIGPATVNRYLATLSSIFNCALNHDFIDEHPMKGGKVRKLDEPPGRQRVATREELARMYKAAAESPWPLMSLFVEMVFTTAARKREILDLEWSQVDMDRGLAVLPTSKNGRPRVICLVPDVVAGLRQACADPDRPADTARVFFNPRSPTSPKYVDALWKTVRIRAGLWDDQASTIDRFVFHTGRHTGCTALSASGLDGMQARKISGHETDSAWRTYDKSVITPELHAAAIAAFSPFSASAVAGANQVGPATDATAASPDPIA